MVDQLVEGLAPELSLYRGYMHPRALGLWDLSVLT